MKRGLHIHPFRYPFADIFVYSYNKTYDVYTYRKENAFHKIFYNKGFKPVKNATQRWPQGTKLKTFGDFKMRVSVDNRRYLESLFSLNWYNIGITSAYDHYNDAFKFPISFRIPQRLYSPAMPFCLSTVKCWRNINAISSND